MWDDFPKVLAKHSESLPELYELAASFGGAVGSIAIYGLSNSSYAGPSPGAAELPTRVAVCHDVVRRAVQDAARSPRGHRAILERHLAIDDDEREPFGVLMRLFERGAIPHDSGVEYRNISLHALTKHAPIGQSQPLSR